MCLDVNMYRGGNRMGRRKYDLLGKKYNKLTVIKETSTVRKNGKTIVAWICQCDCGNFVVLEGGRIATGHDKSCGCSQTLPWNASHGMSETKEYGIWCGMKRRCNDPNNSYFKKGIKVCERWQNSFQNFYEDMGPRPFEDYSIERINNNKGYEPSNCKWASKSEQVNNRTVSVMLTFDGKTQSLKVWSDEVSIPIRVLQSRIYSCRWSVEKALTVPYKPKPRKTESSPRGPSLSRTKEYYTWFGMIKRCEKGRYKERGITVCNEWKDNFFKFLEDMGYAPGKEYSLDRINNDSNYCKENCRWTTIDVQHKNRSCSLYFTYNEKTQTAKEWARELGITYGTLLQRINHQGWTLERALSTPKTNKNEKQWFGPPCIICGKEIKKRMKSEYCSIKCKTKDESNRVEKLLED